MDKKKLIENSFLLEKAKWAIQKYECSFALALAIETANFAKKICFKALSLKPLGKAREFLFEIYSVELFKSSFFAQKLSKRLPEPIAFLFSKINSLNTESLNRRFFLQFQKMPIAYAGAIVFIATAVNTFSLIFFINYLPSFEEMLYRFFLAAIGLAISSIRWDFETIKRKSSIVEFSADWWENQKTTV